MNVILQMYTPDEGCLLKYASYVIMGLKASFSEEDRVDKVK